MKYLFSSNGDSFRRWIVKDARPYLRFKTSCPMTKIGWCVFQFIPVLLIDMSGKNFTRPTHWITDASNYKRDVTKKGKRADISLLSVIMSGS